MAQSLKEILLKLLDDIGIFTEGDLILLKERRLARQLKKAKKIANAMHQETNKRYYVLKSNFSMPFKKTGPYYVISSSEIGRCRKSGALSKHMTAGWLFEHADYFTP